MNIMMLHAAIYAGWWDGMDPAYLALFRWAALILATPLTLWCASPFFAGAFGALRHGVLHMDVPLALAIGVLYLQGFSATLLGHDTYLDSLGMLVALLLAGRFLESRGRRRAAEAAVTLDHRAD
jgi:Cu2+-exporting ATPase